MFNGWKLSLILLLSGCLGGENAPETWQTYSNSRYGFEFPYPSHWVALPAPLNEDGRAFIHPDHPNVEIRGWGQQQLFSAQRPLIDPNFTTQQRLQGELHVEIRPQMSVMTLTLIQGQTVYSWQGRSPNEQFAEHYPLFEAIARRYHILSPKGSLK